MHSHAIMFHHLHDELIHAKGQGSISAADFELIINVLNENFNILDPDDYSQRSTAGKLCSNDISLTFDDALKCQYDIAAPILNRYDIRAFFFVYSSVFGDDPDPLEYYRDFRNSCFHDIESFYNAFFSEFGTEHPDYSKKYEESYPKDYLNAFPFYTDNDRRFRFIRDKILGVKMYNSILERMMKTAGYSKYERRKVLFMDRYDIVSLASHGHTIGLHSHTHPTQMHLLPESAQRLEYQKNQEFLQDAVGVKPYSMSHPCGNYNSSTLGILNDLGISIGFRSSMMPPMSTSTLEIPREDHTNLLKQIKQTGCYL